MLNCTNSGVSMVGEAAFTRYIYKLQQLTDFGLS